MQTDTILTIRCRYCMAGIDFRPMIAHKDGRFVCRDCAHTVPRRARLPVYLPPLLEAVPENSLTDAPFDLPTQ
jgi:hypothetical protein